MPGTTAPCPWAMEWWATVLLVLVVQELGREHVPEQRHAEGRTVVMVAREEVVSPVEHVVEVAVVVA